MSLQKIIRNLAEELDTLESAEWRPSPVLQAEMDDLAQSARDLSLVLSRQLVPFAREPEAVAEEPAPAPFDDAGGLPVLLVEDNLVNRKLATLILEKVGCQVDVAINGAEGVEKFSQGHYEAIFMDCQMPIMDGYQATRNIREQEKEGTRIPIIAVTANAMKGDREKCLACGMDDYISKPLRPNDLQEAVARWCRVVV